jgi:hypothetical protein
MRLETKCFLTRSRDPTGVDENHTLEEKEAGKFFEAYHIAIEPSVKGEWLRLTELVGK